MDKKMKKFLLNEYGRPACVCEHIENELINEKYDTVINYVIDRRKEIENEANYKTYQEIISMYLELQQENKQLKENRDKAIEYIEDEVPCIHDEEILDDLLEILKGDDK